MKTKLLFTLLFAFLLTTVQSQIWDEGIDGDLSDEGSNPSGVFVLEADTENIFIANQVGNPRDVDFFTFTVPEDFELQEIIVTDYISSDDIAFIGIDSGTSTNLDFNNPDPADLIGGTTYGTASIGGDILEAMGLLAGATGFTPPLPAGDYTIWLSQTGDISEGTLNFVVGQALSVADNKLVNSISILPNPVQNTFQIVSSENIDSVTLYDILGKEIRVARNNSTVDISDLSTGIYIAQITTPTETITKRVIKQ